MRVSMISFETCIKLGRERITRDFDASKLKKFPIPSKKLAFLSGFSSEPRNLPGAWFVNDRVMPTSLLKPVQCSVGCHGKQCLLNLPQAD